MAKRLVNIKPGKWASRIREDVHWLINKMRTKGNLQNILKKHTIQIDANKTNTNVYDLLNNPR